METLQRTANRGSVSTGYDVDNSVVFEDANSESLHKSLSSQSRDCFTISFWLKRTALGAQRLVGAGADGNNEVIIHFTSSNELEFYSWEGANAMRYKTNRVFRDTSAFYHFAFLVDTRLSTASERTQIYVNGVLETSFSVSVVPGQNALFDWTNNIYVGKGGAAADADMSGYLSEFVYLDDTKAAHTDLGEFDSDTGIWKPIDVSGLTFGTNGAYLDFKDSSNLGNDANGGTDFTATNITAADQATDTPTNNFATLNPLSYNVPYTASQGNTKYVKNDNTYGMASGTHYVGAGKWYWEVKTTDFGNYSNVRFGIIDAYKPTVGANEYGYEDPSLAATNPEILAVSGALNWYMNSSSTITNNGTLNVDYTFYDGDIMAIALDMDNGGLWIGNSRFSGVANGSFWMAPGGTTTSGSVATTDPTNGNYALVGDGGGTNSGTPNFNGGTITGGSLLTAGFTLVTPIIGAYDNGNSVTLEVNFGGFTSYGEDGGYSDANGHGNFAYAVPSGFYCLCSKNIAEFGGSG